MMSASAQHAEDLAAVAAGKRDADLDFIIWAFEKDLSALDTDEREFYAAVWRRLDVLTTPSTA